MCSSSILVYSRSNKGVKQAAQTLFGQLTLSVFGSAERCNLWIRYSSDHEHPVSTYNSYGISKTNIFWGEIDFSPPIPNILWCGTIHTGLDTEEVQFIVVKNGRRAAFDAGNSGAISGHDLGMPEYYV